MTDAAVAEFFAGIGLMRAGLEAGGRFRVAWANDVEPSKEAMYRAQHPGDQDGRFLLADVRGVTAERLPHVDLVTASFPCTDLSLAGGRRGLRGGESRMFWEFARILTGLREAGRAPRVVLVENVIGFATSHGGADLEAAIEALNALGYVCDLLALDAAWFLPQSRARLFVVGAVDPRGDDAGWAPSMVRPEWIERFVAARPHLKMHAMRVPDPTPAQTRFADVAERLDAEDPLWWEAARVEAFVGSLSGVQRDRLDVMAAGGALSWRTAYRRTRAGKAVWEIRADEIAGCLRTVRGGSSRQAVVEAGRGRVRVRWMTPREYARLQGAPGFPVERFRPNEVYFGFGDAVCVPVIAWIAGHYLATLLEDPNPGRGSRG